MTNITQWESSRFKQGETGFQKKQNDQIILKFWKYKAKKQCGGLNKKKGAYDKAWCGGYKHKVMSDME